MTPDRLTQQNRYTVLVLTFLAWVFWLVATAHCTFMILKTNINDTPLAEGFGFFHVAEYEDGEIRGCLKYNDTVEFGGMANLSRYVGAITAALVTLSFLLVTSLIVFVGKEGMQRLLLLIIRITNPTATILGGFSFGFFTLGNCKDENASCEPGAGGIVGAIGIALLLIVSILCFLITIPPSPILIPAWQVDQMKQWDAPPEQSRSVDPSNPDLFEPEPENSGAMVKYQKPRNHTVEQSQTEPESEGQMINFEKPKSANASNPQRQQTRSTQPRQQQVKGLSTQPQP